MTRRYAGTHGAAAPPRRPHWRRAPDGRRARPIGRGPREWRAARPHPAPFLPGPRFLPGPSRPPAGGPGRGGRGAAGRGRPGLINQRLAAEAGGGDATQGGKKGRAGGAGRRPPRAQGPALPPLTQLIGLGASAGEGALQGAGADRDQGARPSAQARAWEGRWHSPTPGPRTASPPPHWLGPGGGSELGCPPRNSLRPQHTLRRADPAPGLGVGRASPPPPPPPLRVSRQVSPLVPGPRLVYEHPISHR